MKKLISLRELRRECFWSRLRTDKGQDQFGKGEWKPLTKSLVVILSTGAVLVDCRIRIRITLV